MGRLTTHVLDTAAGRPGQGIRIELFRLAGAARDKIAEGRTNDDGRLDAPILEGEALTAGSYELVFHAGEYLAGNAIDTGDPRFLDTVPIRFGVADPGQHYHVPLLLSPYGYTTYRGS